MPAALDRCVADLLADPEFSPQNPDETKESAAYAVCSASTGLKADDEMDDEEMRRRVKEYRAKAAAIDSGQDVLIKEIVIARAGKNFKNGDMEFDLTREDIDSIIKNTKKLGRQIQILLTPDHIFGSDRSAIPAAGWVEDMHRRGDDWIAKVKLIGEAAVGVRNDTYRGVSIGTGYTKNQHGQPTGEVLDHLLITNTPFFPGLNIAAIAASRLSGGDEVSYITARRGNSMTDEEKAKADADAKAKAAAQHTNQDEKAIRARIEDELVVPIKAENLRLKGEIESLQGQLANAKVDVDKEALAVENINLRRDLFAMKIRAVVDQGLKSGTLKASWCDGYAGKGAVDYDATMRWLKASRFYDAAVSEPETAAFRILKFTAENNPPLYKMEQRFTSGTPSGAQSLTLSQEQQDGIRKLGLDPERIAAMTDHTDFTEWKRLKAQGGKA